MFGRCGAQPPRRRLRAPAWHRHGVGADGADAPRRRGARPRRRRPGRPSGRRGRRSRLNSGPVRPGRGSRRHPLVCGPPVRSPPACAASGAAPGRRPRVRRAHGRARCTMCRCSPIPPKLRLPATADAGFAPSPATALMATRLDRIDDVTERALTEVLPESRAVVDQSRIYAATPWRADYRFVTNS